MKSLKAGVTDVAESAEFMENVVEFVKSKQNKV